MTTDNSKACSLKFNMTLFVLLLKELHCIVHMKMRLGSEFHSASTKLKYVYIICKIVSIVEFFFFNKHQTFLPCI